MSKHGRREQIALVPKELPPEPPRGHDRTLLLLSVIVVASALVAVFFAGMAIGGVLRG